VNKSESTTTDTCIVLLACKDFESTQLSLTNILAKTDPSIPIFVLLNSMERTFDSNFVKNIVGIYANLHPNRITIANWVAPNVPYIAIRDLLLSPQLADYEYICKMDDDVFPLTPDWLDKLRTTHDTQPDNASPFVSGLINNNPWGFGELMDILSLQNELAEILPQQTRTGVNMPGYMSQKIVELPDIDRAGFGTVWAFPNLARWIHEKTTLQPEAFIEATANLSPKGVPPGDRYSIGCLFMRKQRWLELEKIGGSKIIVDEQLLHMHTMQSGEAIICDRSVPLVHLFFNNQRIANKALLPKAYSCYKEFLGTEFQVIIEVTDESQISMLEERLKKQEATTEKRRFINRLKKIFTEIRR
jgi:hypothetical protein